MDHHQPLYYYRLPPTSSSWHLAKVCDVFQPRATLLQGLGQKRLFVTRLSLISMRLLRERGTYVQYMRSSYSSLVPELSRERTQNRRPNIWLTQKKTQHTCSSLYIYIYRTLQNERGPQSWIVKFPPLHAFWLRWIWGTKSESIKYRQNKWSIP